MSLLVLIMVLSMALSATAASYAPPAAPVINYFTTSAASVEMGDTVTLSWDVQNAESIEIIGIEKNITHHTARKTFASTVLLYNDVPMEIVSELLGHSKMSITQEHYGKIVQKKVSEHINALAKKLKK